MPHRKDFLKFFFHFKSMRAVDCQGGGGGGAVCTQGALLAGFKWGSTRRCHIINIYGFKRFLFHNTCTLCSNIDPPDVAIFEPRGFIGRIYVGDY